MNYKNYLKTIVFALFIPTLLLTSCKKDKNRPDEPKKQIITGTKGVYILNEGQMGSDDGSMSYYDYETGKLEQDIFKKVNGRNLGETPNELKAYGSKMYCLISGIQQKKQSFVEVLDIETGKSLKTISFNNAAAEEASMPRFVTFDKGKAYVASYDGKISRIDTTSLTVDKELQLMNGVNKAQGLEELTVTKDKLYVTNSSHPFYPDGLKTKVTVIDLNTFTKIKDIEVGNNPNRIAATDNGFVYVVTWNDISVGNKPTFVKIDATTDKVVQTEDGDEYDFGVIKIERNKGYVSSINDIKLFSLETGKLTGNFVTDNTAIGYINALTVNPFDESVLATEYTGQVYILDRLGKLKYKFNTPTGPKTAVFKYNYKYE